MDWLSLYSRWQVLLAISVDHICSTGEDYISRLYVFVPRLPIAQQDYNGFNHVEASRGPGPWAKVTKLVVDKLE